LFIDIAATPFLILPGRSATALGSARAAFQKFRKNVEMNPRQLPS
jgi:hypothetical protein